MRNILEQANEIIANFEDDMSTVEMIEERRKNDSGIRYTDDDVDKILEEKRKKSKDE